MSTTDILFNSPALHSLKRAQLVQLCKRHNIKASGKNTDLVDRLKEHARSLPSGDPLNVAIRSEKHSGYPLDDRTSEDGSEDDGLGLGRPQRPSEMWEVVMEDIPEEENYGSLPGSLSSKSMLTAGASGEFGTGGSSQSTIGSSIKALATSLGLKQSTSASSIPTSESKDTITSLKSLGKGKNGSNHSGGSNSRRVLSNLASSINGRDSLTANAIPYDAIPPKRDSQLPVIEPFAFSYNNAADTSISSVDQLVPGVGSRTGVDANASVGMETVRLITAPSNGKRTVPESPALPRLAPIRPTFDLVPPTPGNAGLKKWPMSPGAGSSNGLYPSLNFEMESNGMDIEVPGDLAASEKPKDKELLSPSRPEPFVFGSPHPRHSASKGDFAKAANSIISEMNARLGLAGTTNAVGIDLLASRSNNSKLSEEDILNYQFGGKKAGQNKDDEGDAKGSVGWKFDRAHEKAFSKMDGIDTHYAARRGKETQEPLAPLPANRKRKSSAIEPENGLGNGRPSAAARANKRRSSQARVISAGARRKMGMGIPGAFGDDDDEEDDEPEEEVESQPKRVCVEQPASNGNPPKRVSIAPKSNPPKDIDEDEMTRKQNEAIKRRLDYNKAKRRSSRGRPSIAPRNSSAAQKQKGATSRFGFLSSAKSLVKSVWNRGAGGTTQQTSIPMPKPAPAKPAPIEQKKGVPAAASTKPPVPDAKKPSFTGLGAGSGMRPSTSSRAPTSRNVSTSSNGLLKPDDQASRNGTMRSTNSAMSVMSNGSAMSNATNASDRRSRSPIPSFNAPGDSTQRKVSNSSSGPVFGSTKVRSSGTKGPMAPPPPPSAASRASISSATGGTGSSSVGSMGTKSGVRMRPSSTLYAPTASSLAKTNANLARRSSVLNKNAETANSSIASRRSVLASPMSTSRIPVILPLSPKKKTAGDGSQSGIFSSPLVLPSSPAAKDAERTGQRVNPITGLRSPSTSSRLMPGIEQSFGVLAEGEKVGMGTVGTVGSMKSTMSTATTTSMRRNPSAVRKPRISRSKVIAKLGAQRAASQSQSSTSNAQAVTSRPSAAAATSRKGRTRSSVGAAVARRSVGASRARDSGGAALLMSAKKRARMSEYARRRSTKVGKELRLGAEMDVDDD